MSDRLLDANKVAEPCTSPVSWRESTRSGAGAMPHVELGRYRRYRREGVEKWLRSAATGPPDRASAKRRTVATSGETELCRVRGGTFRRLFPSSPWKGRRLARRLSASADRATLGLA